MKGIISFLLLAILILQSCIVYQKASTPLADAVDKGRVLVINHNDEKVKFRSIQNASSSGKYMCMALKKGNQPVEITESEVSKIYLKSKAKSTIATIGIAVGGGFLLIITIALISLSNNGLINTYP